jgi:hypothetical protein
VRKEVVMANDPRPRHIARLAVDATGLVDILVDLPQGARQRLRGDQPGVELVLGEIVSNQPDYGERAGVTAANFEEMLRLSEHIARIDELLPDAHKLVELLDESRALLVDRRHRLISAVASAVDMYAKARQDDELLARYEKTRAYRSAIAKKAWRTRRRKQQAAAVAAENAGKNEP